MLGKRLASTDTSNSNDEESTRGIIKKKKRRIHSPILTKRSFSNSNDEESTTGIRKTRRKKRRTRSPILNKKRSFSNSNAEESTRGMEKRKRNRKHSPILTKRPFPNSSNNKHPYFPTKNTKPYKRTKTYKKPIPNPSNNTSNYTLSNSNSNTVNLDIIKSLFLTLYKKYKANVHNFNNNALPLSVLNRKIEKLRDLCMKNYNSIKAKIPKLQYEEFIIALLYVNFSISRDDVVINNTGTNFMHNIKSAKDVFIIYYPSYQINKLSYKHKFSRFNKAIIEITKQFGGEIMNINDIGPKSINYFETT
jgi:hypothetical protein